MGNRVGNAAWGQLLGDPKSQLTELGFCRQQGDTEQRQDTELK